MCLSEDVFQFDISQLLKKQDNLKTYSTTQDIFKQSAVREDTGEFKTNETITKEEKEINKSSDKINFYDFFLLKLQYLIGENEKTADELFNELDLNKTQLSTWLKQAIKDKKIKKLSKPVRYQWQANKAQVGMFDD